MTADEALALLERTLDTEYLSKTQIDIFRKVWDGESYVAIATSLGYEHGYVKDTGAQLWRLLSRVLGKKVTKSNVRNILCSLSHQVVTNQTSLASITDPNQSWGEAADISRFYGRGEEQSRLEAWLVQERCRLVSILGIGGVGKTALSVKLAKQVQSQFNYVAWRTLRQAPPLLEVLSELILFFSDQQDTQVPDTAAKQIEQLLSYLREKKCLLVLDNFESILKTGDRTGKYRHGYEDYGLLLERIADGAHQSCLVITSREKPMGLAYREMDGGKVRSHLLTGLTPTASEEILNTLGIQGSGQQQLINRYSGNPLALKIVAATIRSVFAGDVAEFLDYGTVVFGDLWDLLDQQFNRLSALEQTVMRWLAINREWTSLKELRADIVPAVSHRALLEAVESLKARCLVETSRAGITQQPVVMEYMTERLVEQFYQEISEQDYQLFSQYALLKANAKEFVREAQIRQLSQPLLEKLLNALGSTIELQLQQLLQAFKHQPKETVGYAGGNLLNLLCQLDVDLQGQDFSYLPLWQVYLLGKDLQNVNLAHADLSKSVFSDSLASIISIAFSPDGEWLVAGDTNGEIHIWQVADGQKIFAWKAHDGWIWSVAFNSDREKLASSSEDGTVKVWSVKEQQQLVHNFQLNRNRIWSVVWHPNGQQIASGGENGTVLIWDLRTHECVQTLETNQKSIEPVAFSPDGQVLACGSSTDSAIHILDVNRGECLQTLVGHTNGIWSVVFSPDGQSLISGSSDTTVRIWDWVTGKCRRVLQGHQEIIWSVATNQDGSLVASGSDDHTVRIWDSYTGQCLRTLQGFKSRVWSVAFNLRSPLLASGNDEAVKLWSVTTGQCLKTFKGCPQLNWSVIFMPNSSQLASSGQDQLVRIWDWQAGTCIQTSQKHPSYVYAISHHPVEPVLASISANTTYVWNLATWGIISTLEGHGAQIWQVAFSPDGALLATCSFDHTARVWDWRSGSCLNVLQGHSSWTYCLRFSPDGRWLATGSMDKSIRLWDVETGECFKTIETGTEWITELEVSPDGQHIVSGSVSGVLMLWSVNGDMPLRTVQAHGGHISAIYFSPDGQTVVTGSHDCTIKLWDAVTWECLKTLTGHTNLVVSAAFSADGKTLASASHDETVRVWDVGTGECLQVLRSPRPYEGMKIEGATGLADTQKATLQMLGAIET